MNILKLYKNSGETPLECLERFKKDNPEYKDEKMTYAGRLDPLAEGLLLVLVGEECKNKEKYLGLDKEYEVDVLFGFATDTYDLLGKVTSCLCEEQSDVATQVNESRLLHFVRNDTTNELLNSFVGRFSQKYPLYSSKNIKNILKIRNGKNEGLALRSEAGKGESQVFSEEDKNINKKDVEIKSIELLGQKTISKNDLEKYITESIALVKGDFRQNEILESWCIVFANEAKQSRLYQIVSIRVNCTSGTYMRSLANSIGEKIGIPVLALNIKRTRIGSIRN